jgi:uncharacterized membrane protein YphA (DoxX/SURF4 family)
MDTVRHLLADAQARLDTAIARAGDPDGEALDLARDAAQLALRTVLLDRGIRAQPDTGPDALEALLAEAGVEPPETVTRVAGIGEPVAGEAEALGAASAAVMWAAASLTPA